MVESKIVFIQTDEEPRKLAGALSHIPAEFNLFFFIFPLKDKLFSKAELLEMLENIPD